VIVALGDQGVDPAAAVTPDERTRVDHRRVASGREAEGAGLNKVFIHVPRLAWGSGIGNPKNPKFPPGNGMF